MQHELLAERATVSVVDSSRTKLDRGKPATVTLALLERKNLRISSIAQCVATSLNAADCTHVSFTIWLLRYITKDMKSTLYILVVLCCNIHCSIFWKIRKLEANGWIVTPSEDYCIRILYWTHLIFYRRKHSPTHVPVRVFA
jgi:hypothetical protein